MKKELIIILSIIFLSGCVPMESVLCGNNICEEGEVIVCPNDCGDEIAESRRVADKVIGHEEEIAEVVEQKVDEAIEEIECIIYEGRERCLPKSEIKKINETPVEEELVQEINNKQSLIDLSDQEIWDRAINGKIGECYIQDNSQKSTGVCDYYVKSAVPGPDNGYGWPKNKDDGTATGCVVGSKRPGIGCFNYKEELKKEICTDDYIKNAANAIRDALRNNACGIVNIQENTCTDSDGGNEIYVKGSATGFSSYLGRDNYVNDFCADGVLREAVCDENTNTAGFITTTCSNGCGDGVCLEENECQSQGYKCTSRVRGCGHYEQINVSCGPILICCEDIPSCGDGVCFDLEYAGENPENCPEDCPEENFEWFMIHGDYYDPTSFLNTTRGIQADFISTCEEVCIDLGLKADNKCMGWDNQPIYCRKTSSVTELMSAGKSCNEGKWSSDIGLDYCCCGNFNQTI